MESSNRLQKISIGYTTLTKETDKFYMTVYFGIQFHVLLYYRVDTQVIDIQKELMKIEETAASVSDI